MIVCVNILLVEGFLFLFKLGFKKIYSLGRICDKGIVSLVLTGLQQERLMEWALVFRVYGIARPARPGDLYLSSSVCSI